MENKTKLYNLISKLLSTNNLLFVSKNPKCSSFDELESFMQRRVCFEKTERIGDSSQFYTQFVKWIKEITYRFDLDINIKMIRQFLCLHITESHDPARQRRPVTESHDPAPFDPFFQNMEQIRNESLKVTIKIILGIVYLEMENFVKKKWIEFKEGHEKLNGYKLNIVSFFD